MKSFRVKIRRFCMMFSMLVSSWRKRPFWALIFITRRCQQNCKFCYVASTDGGFMPLEKFQDAVQHLKVLGVKTISLFGGNITLHPDLVKMIEYIRANGLYSYLSIDLSSCSRRKLEEICKTAPDVISFSCDCLVPEAGDRRGLSAIKEKIALIRHTPSILLQCNIALLKGNLDEVTLIISQLHDFCKSIGFTIFPTSFPFETLKDVSEARNFQVGAEEERRVGKIISWVKERKKEGWTIMNPSFYLDHLVEYLRGTNTWHCSANNFVLTINVDGSLMQCSYEPPEGLHLPLEPLEVNLLDTEFYRCFFRAHARDHRSTHRFHVADLDRLLLRSLSRITKRNQRESGCTHHCFSQAYTCTTGYGSSMSEWFRLLRGILRA